MNAAAKRTAGYRFDVQPVWLAVGQANSLIFLAVAQMSQTLTQPGLDAIINFASKTNAF
jgi:hypothetical protein